MNKYRLSQRTGVCAYLRSSAHVAARLTAPWRIQALRSGWQMSWGSLVPHTLIQQSLLSVVGPDPAEPDTGVADEMCLMLGYFYTLLQPTWQAVLQTNPE